MSLLPSLAQAQSSALPVIVETTPALTVSGANVTSLSLEPFPLSLP